MIFEKSANPIPPSWIVAQMKLPMPQLNMNIPDYLRCPSMIIPQNNPKPQPLNDFQRQCIEYEHKCFPHCGGGGGHRARTNARKPH